MSYLVVFFYEQIAHLLISVPMVFVLSMMLALGSACKY